MQDELDNTLDRLNHQPKLDNNMPKTTSLWLDRYEIKQAIEELLIKAYRNGYNDNARDCYCYLTIRVDLIPHKHLIDDGDSYDIRPNINKLLKKEEV